MEHESINSEVHDAALSSLAIQTGVKPRTSGNEMSTTSQRVGPSGALYDLETHGRLDEVRPLLAQLYVLRAKRQKIEFRLRHFLNLGGLHEFLQSHRDPTVSQKMLEEIERLELKKKDNETEQTAILTELSMIDPRFGDEIVPPVPALPAPAGAKRQSRSPEVLARNAVIARFSKMPGKTIVHELDAQFPFDEEHQRPAPQLPEQWYRDGATSFSMALEKFPNRVYRVISAGKA